MGACELIKTQIHVIIGSEALRNCIPSKRSEERQAQSIVASALASVGRVDPSFLHPHQQRETCDRTAFPAAR